MADDADNHTIKLLQEMRREISDRFDDVDTRIDGVTHILTLMAGHSHDLDARIESLETTVGPGKG
uniref:hypothetical protein n=1 Tax=Roseovarius indicus TaxID=540747 RepID=UPI003B52557B